MKCPDCGVEVPSGAGFCHECGTELPRTAAPASTATEPAVKQTSESYIRTTQQCPVLDRPGDGATQVAVVESGAALRVLSRDWTHVDGRDYVKVAYEGRPVYIDRGYTVPAEGRPAYIDRGYPVPADERQGEANRPGAEFVAKALFVVGWAALVLGLLGAIGAASADYCQDTFFSDCSGEGNIRAVGFFVILIMSILYALPNFALSYTLKYLADLERRGT